MKDYRHERDTLVRRPCEQEGCVALAQIDVHNLRRDEHLVVCLPHFAEWMDTVAIKVMGGDGLADQVREARTDA